MSKLKYNIAIDGSAGTGKSSVSKILEDKLGLKYISTGAMYRAIAVYFKQETNSKVDPSKLSPKFISFNYDQNGDIILNETNIQALTRTEEISELTSIISTNKEVRDYATFLQREIAQNGGYILEGRDIGTVVLPDARYKFFLTASPRVQAERRAKEYAESGKSVDLKALEDQIRIRDERDTNRAIAPLKAADDAIIVNTDNKDLEQVINEILNIINNKENNINKGGRS